MSIVVLMWSDRLRFKRPPLVTERPRPLLFSPMPTLQPGLQPAVLAWQYSTPVNPTNGVLKPSCAPGTQNPFVNPELIVPGRIDVSFAKPDGVMRICAPP